MNKNRFFARRSFEHGTNCFLFPVWTSEFVRMMSRWACESELDLDSTTPPRGEEERPAMTTGGSWTCFFSELSVKNNKTTTKKQQQQQQQHINPAVKASRRSTKADVCSREPHWWLNAAALSLFRARATPTDAFLTFTKNILNIPIFPLVIMIEGQRKRRVLMLRQAFSVNNSSNRHFSTTDRAELMRRIVLVTLPTMWWNYFTWSCRNCAFVCCAYCRLSTLTSVFNMSPGTDVGARLRPAHNITSSDSSVWCSTDTVLLILTTLCIFYCDMFM